MAMEGKRWMGTKCEIFYIDAEIRFRLENGKSFSFQASHILLASNWSGIYLTKFRKSAKESGKKHKKAE